MFDVDRWLLADPRLAVDFLGTRRRQGDAFAGELPDGHEATAWVRDHVGYVGADTRSQLLQLRAVLRDVLTAIVDGAQVPRDGLDSINDLAARGPVTLTARLGADGFVIDRASPASSDAVLRADIARSALALLAEPARAMLRLCRAPGCTLFFLAERPRQQWCSTSCGNRARVARHYARRAHDRAGHEPP